MSLTDQNRLADFILEMTYPTINRLDIKPVLRQILAQNLSSLDSSVSKSHRRANRRIIRLRLLIRSKFISKRK